MEEVCQRENLEIAWKRVRENKGSAGVDGMTIDAGRGLSAGALARDSGTAAKRNLQAATGQAGGNP